MFIKHVTRNSSIMVLAAFGWKTFWWVISLGLVSWGRWWCSKGLLWFFGFDVGGLKKLSNSADNLNKYLLFRNDNIYNINCERNNVFAK